MNGLRTVWVVVVGIALVAGTVGASPYSTAVTGDGAIGYWRLGDAAAAGTAANSGSGGALIAGTYTPPKVNAAGLIPGDPDTAADFNGTSSQVWGTGLNAVPGGNPFVGNWTIEAWFKRDTATDWAGVVSNNRGGMSAPLMTFSGPSGPSNHNLGVNGAGITGNGVWVDLSVLTGPQSYLGKAVYAMITKTGGNGSTAATLTVTANVGGVWLGPVTGTNNGWAFTPQDGYYIGQHAVATQNLDGVIDEAAIYSAALSQAQMLNHYYAAAGQPTPYAKAVLAHNPVGFWHLSEVVGANTAGSYGTQLGRLNAAYSPPRVDAAGLMGTNSDRAADFNGIQSPAGTYLTGSGLNFLPGGNPFSGNWSIEAWFVHDATHAWSGIFSNAAGAGGPLMTFIDTTNRVGINGPAVTPNNVSVDLGPGHFGQPIYAVITKTGDNAPSTANLIVYANVGGTWLTPVSGTNVGWTLTPYDGFYIGRHFGGSWEMFDGIIDEVALYNYALSQYEIFQHYGASMPEPGTLVLLGGGLLALARRRRK